MNNVAMLPADHAFASLVQDLLDNTPSVIYVKDVQFRYLLINRQFETLFHLNRSAIVGQTDFDVFPQEMAERFRANDRQVLEDGKVVQCEEVAPHDDGPHSYFSIKFPLRDAQGKTYAMAGISTDVTDRKSAEREMASLQQRHHLILASVGDGICGIDRQGRIEFLNPAAERMLQWTTAELRGCCHSKVAVTRMRGGAMSHDSEPAPVVAVLNGQGATQVQGASFRRRDKTVFPVEYTVAPISDEQVTVGAVVAFRDTSDRLKQLETEQEIQTARRIQISLYPKQAPEIPGFDFAALSLPCTKACGDYFDFINWGPNQLGIAVGDVSGHGLGPALEMVATRAILRTTMLIENNPAHCLTRLNLILAQDLPDDMFVSLFLASLNTVDRTITYAAAGHDAMILSRSGELQRLESTGAVLGMNKTEQFVTGETVALHSGDLVLISTDGITESVSPSRELFGRHRVADVLRRHQASSARDILAAIQAATEAFRAEDPQRDDMTAVVIKIL
jgi:PAS domain S-box-containing protein